MLIQKDGAASVGSDQEYQADKDGIIDVPAELGEVLVRTHGFVEVVPDPEAPARAPKAAKAAEPPAPKETAAAKKKREAEEAKAAKAAEPPAGTVRDRSDGIDKGAQADDENTSDDDDDDSDGSEEDAAE